MVSFKQFSLSLFCGDHGDVEEAKGCGRQKGIALTLIRFDGVFRVAYVGYATLDDEHNSFVR